jgi:LPS sulfotransferase NodH
MKLAHGISEMRPVPKTERIRHLLVKWLSIKHDSAPPGVIPFVVVATQRSGSSLLMDLLASRWASIRGDGEIFNPHVRRGRSVGEILGATYFSDSGHRCVGSKIIRRQVSDDELKTVLAIPGLRVIVLQRENVVRQFVSLKIARKDNIWRQPARYPRSDVMVRAVVISVDELLAYESRQRQAYESLEGLLSSTPCLHTTYEELMENRDLEIERIGDFLGVGKPDRSTSPRLRHQNPEPLFELIGNFDQLRSELSDLGREDLASQLGTRGEN